MRQINILQYLAIGSMLIDHLADLYGFPFISNTVGRLAYPAYSMLLGYSLTFKADRQHLFRILLVAVIAQLPFSIFFGVELNYLNICFSFAAAVLIVIICRFQKIDSISKIGILAGVGILLVGLSTNLEYQGWAIVMPLAWLIFFRMSNGFWFFPFILATAFLANIGKGMAAASSAAISCILIYLTCRGYIWHKDVARIPAVLWRGFYPVHLLILAALSRFG